MNTLLLSALRMLAVAALGAGAGWWVRRPAQRLRLWRAVLYAGLAMPLLVLALPPLEIPLLRAPAAAPRIAPATAVATPITAPTPALRPMMKSMTTLPSAAATPVQPWRMNRGKAAIAVYLAVAGFLLLRLATGLWLGWRLRRLATPAPAAGPRVLVSELIAVPLTSGVLHPMIVLPRQWEQWPRPTLAAVLAHETAHLERGDTRTQILSRLHRALFWFSPLSWWLVAHLEALAERASDEAALCQGAEPNAYAEALLTFFARLSGEPDRVWWRGVAMARGGSPLDRIQEILSWQGDAPMKAQSRAFRSLLTMAAACAVAMAASVRPVPRRAPAPMPQTQTPPAVPTQAPQAPAETVKLLAPAQLTPTQAVAPPQAAATPARMQGRRLLVLYFDLTTMAPADRENAVASARNYVSQRMTGSDLVAVAALDQHLEVRQDFTADKDLLLRTLDAVATATAPPPTAGASLQGLKTLSNMLAPINQNKSVLFFSDGITRSGDDNELTLRDAVQAAARANVTIYSLDARGLGVAPPPPQAAAPLQVSATVATEMCASCPEPSSPDPATAGTVSVHVVVATDGTVKSAVVSGAARSGNHEALDQVALAAVKAWRFKPLMLDIQPIEYQTDMDVTVGQPPPMHNVLYQWNGNILNAYDYFNASGQRIPATSNAPAKLELTGCLALSKSHDPARDGYTTYELSSPVRRLFFFYDNEGQTTELPAYAAPAPAQSDVWEVRALNPGVDLASHVGAPVTVTGDIGSRHPDTAVGGPADANTLVVNSVAAAPGSCPAQ